MPSTIGYSGTPLAKKLGIGAGVRIAVIGAPPTYRASLAPLPRGVDFTDTVDERCDLVHLFTAEREILASALPAWRRLLGPEAVVWASWPKKASKVTTDIDEHVVREVALPLGFVDVKVCAVDETWSGLKLVVRKHLR